MGTWFQEEVAGDRYIFDSELNPVVLGCPQGAPVFVIPGEHAAEAERACVAHNAAEARIAELEARIEGSWGLNEWKAEGEKITALYSHRPAYAKSEKDAKYICDCHNDALWYLAQTQAELAQVSEHAPKCSLCGKPATCMGSYEANPFEYACDDCCGHGNEDGECYPVESVPDEFLAIWSRLRTANDELARVKAEVLPGDD